jgi:Zn-dependent protease with chaperone function
VIGLFLAPLIVYFTLAPSKLYADGAVDAARPTAAPTAQNVQQVVDDLRVRLSLSSQVAVTIVTDNPLVVSVAPSRGRDGAFRLSFEERFLAALSEDELRAVVAHELGHVWIFSNHPYLQTERLANSIAQRVVSRESLERVYDKLSGHSGNKSHLRRVLGD